MQHIGPVEGLKKAQTLTTECADAQQCIEDSSTKILKTLDTEIYHVGIEAVWSWNTIDCACVDNMSRLFECSFIFSIHAFPVAKMTDKEGSSQAEIVHQVMELGKYVNQGHVHAWYVKCTGYMYLSMCTSWLKQ